MRSAALALLAAAALLCAPTATAAPKTPKAPKDTACPLELIFPAEQLLTQGKPEQVTLKVINNGNPITNLVISYTVQSGAPNSSGGNYPGVVVTGAGKSSPGAPNPVIAGSPVGKAVSYPAIASVKGSLKLGVVFEAQEGARRSTEVRGTGTYTGPTGASCTAIINVAASSRMAVSTRITPKAAPTLAGQTYQQYTDVYGLCPRVVTTLASSTGDACATECNNQGKGCTAFTFSTNTTMCNTYKASGNQGRQRLTYRYSATMPGGTLQTTIYVKGAKPRALYGFAC